MVFQHNRDWIEAHGKFFGVRLGLKKIKLSLPVSIYGNDVVDLVFLLHPLHSNRSQGDSDTTSRQVAFFVRV